MPSVQDYLGDGAYVEYDGFGYILRANHHTDALCTDRIYLEPSALQSLIDFKNRIIKFKEPSK